MSWLKNNGWLGFVELFSLCSSGRYFMPLALRLVPPPPSFCPGLRRAVGLGRVRGGSLVTVGASAARTGASDLLCVAKGFTSGLQAPSLGPSRATVGARATRLGASGTFLARDTSSPYVDNRALLVAGQPETRTYTAIYVVGDDEIGLASDALVIVAQP